MKKVVFVFDRVAHYHKELFSNLNRELEASGVELFLLSGVSGDSGVGRVGLTEKVIPNEVKFEFTELKIGSFVIRKHKGVINKLVSIKPDLVIVLGQVGNLSHWLLLLISKLYGFKLAAWQCGYEYNEGRLKDLVLRQFVPAFDFHLAYHSNAKKYAINHGAREEDVVVIHNTINEKHIDPLSQEDAYQLISEKHPEVSGRKILLFVGAILKEKKVQDLVAALDMLNRPDVVLMVVGDGDYFSDIKELCANRRDVIMTGSIVDGVGPYFDAASVYLLPGTGGLGINEAMAHSLPIISGYADGSADDLVVHGVNGYRLKENNVEEIARYIEDVVDNPSKAAKMGKESRKMITGVYSFNNFIKRIKGSISSLIVELDGKGGEF